MAETEGHLRRPIVSENCEFNAHLYYVLLPTAQKRDSFLSALNKKEINSVFHYIPLHDSPAGRKYGRTVGSLDVTIDLSQRIVRLPLWIGLEKYQDQVISQVLFEASDRS